MGLLDLIAPGNPISPFLDQNRSNLVSGFAGMVGAGNDPRAALKGFAQGVQQNIPVQQRMQLEQQDRAEKQAQIDLQHQQQNATIAFLQKKYPDLAAAASNGVPLANVYSEMWKRENGGGTGQESWYGNLVPVKDAQGNITYAQVSNRGGFKPIDVPQGMTPVSPVQQLNTGTAFTGVDKFGNPTGGTTPINNQGKAFDTALGTGQGKTEAERPANQLKAESALNTLNQKTNIALNAVDQALNQSNWLTTGMAGSLSSGVPGLPAHDLARTLDTIKANVGFDELQTMRDNSPTGGALGAISERELAFLQSTIANIEQSQSEEQLKRNLGILRDFLASSAQRRQQAFQQQYGGGQQAPASGFTGQTSNGLTWSIEP